MQEVKEQEWNKIAVLQQDKMQLEEELSKAQKLNAHGLSDQQALTTKFRDEIRQLDIDKVACERFKCYNTINRERFTGLNFHVFRSFQEHHESFPMNIYL